MITLSEELQQAIASGVTLVVPSRQRAAAVRLAYAAWQSKLGHAVWASPRVHSLGGWLQRLAQEPARAGRSPLPRILPTHEEWLLWRRAAAAVLDRHPSPGGTALTPDSLADSLQSAAELMGRWGIPDSALAGHGTEAEWLQRALREVRGATGAIGAMPRADLPAVLRGVADAGRPQSGGTGTALVGLALDRGLAEIAGTPLTGPVGSLPLGAPCNPRVVACADPAAEWRAAAEWCRERIQRDPAARLLVVIPDLSKRRPVVERLFREVLEPEALRQACVRGERSGTVAFAVEGGRPLADYPEPAAALVALRAISRPVLSGELALLLEAPWWGPGDRGARARIAARLRADIPQRILTKSIAARLRALAGEGADLARIEGCASAIDAAVARVAAGPGADAHWASVFDAALRALGWPGAGNADSGTQQARLQWRALLEVFVGVSRMEPPRDASRAVDLLAALARREQFAPSSGDVAVLVTAATEAPVARYDGIRVCGLQADRFPAPVQVDPFVPWALQREAGIPRASPEGQLALAASAIDAWRRCTDELVLSWALGEDDAHWMPSPLLAPWQADPAAYRDDATVAQAREAKAAALARSLPVGLRAAAGAGASLEPWRDEQGLPWDPAEALPGGTGALDDQLACPFRAYATRRLHARADEEAEQGISDLERGRLLHLALKIFWDETLDSRRLASLDVAARRDRLQAAVERAVDELGQAGDGDVLRTRLLARERARAVEVGLEALALDATREPFEVLLREAPVEAPVGPARIAGRIDRADRLVGDGSIVIIDYKSGRPRPMKWDGAEMTALQLWSYAIMVESLGIGEVRAVGNLHLARHGIRYAALAESAAGLPDADADGWKEARDDARERLPALAAAFLAGTAQVAPRAHACEHCDLTALCRRSELGLDAPDDDAEGGS